jgi:sigma-B regulation protein RsbU (phosphoserine phosphatase)
VVIRHQNNDLVLLKTGGIALGALPEIQLPEFETVLNPGDCLVLYTDGVTEAFNRQDQMYGDDRFLRVLDRLTGKNAVTVLEALETDLAEFRDGAPLSDDTTLLAICRALSLSDDNRNARTA